MKYEKPLCSDAFSKFTAVDSLDNEYREDVKKATEYLKEKVIPQFAESLCQVKSSLRPSYPWVEALHSKGINIRYIVTIFFQIFFVFWIEFIMQKKGLVRSYIDVKERYWRYIILFGKCKKFFFSISFARSNFFFC